MSDSRIDSAASSTTPVSRVVLLAVFVLVTVVHLLGLYWPRVDLDTNVPNPDKWLHLAGFAAPVAVGWLCFVRTQHPRRAWWVVAAFAAHALISEALQATVLPHRTGDPLDVSVNLVGVGLGTALGAGAARVERALVRKSTPAG